MEISVCMVERWCDLRMSCAGFICMGHFDHCRFKEAGHKDGGALQLACEETSDTFARTSCRHSNGQCDTPPLTPLTRCLWNCEAYCSARIFFAKSCRKLRYLGNN